MRTTKLAPCDSPSKSATTSPNQTASLPSWAGGSGGPAGVPAPGCQPLEHQSGIGDRDSGQVLLAQNDFVIIDFEGEPTRTMEERAQKHSPLQDVAGMLRSFDYAMHTALFKFVSERPDAREAVESAGRQWQEQAAGAFLDGYDEVAHASGAELSLHVTGTLDRAQNGDVPPRRVIL